MGAFQSTVGLKLKSVKTDFSDLDYMAVEVSSGLD